MYHVQGDDGFVDEDDLVNVEVMNEEEKEDVIMREGTKHVSYVPDQSVETNSCTDLLVLDRNRVRLGEVFDKSGVWPYFYLTTQIRKLKDQRKGKVVVEEEESSKKRKKTEDEDDEDDDEPMSKISRISQERKRINVIEEM